MKHALRKRTLLIAAALAVLAALAIPAALLAGRIVSAGYHGIDAPAVQMLQPQTEQPLLDAPASDGYLLHQFIVEDHLRVQLDRVYIYTGALTEDALAAFARVAWRRALVEYPTLDIEASPNHVIRVVFCLSESDYELANWLGKYVYDSEFHPGDPYAIPFEPDLSMLRL